MAILLNLLVKSVDVRERNRLDTVMSLTSPVLLNGIVVFDAAS